MNESITLFGLDIAERVFHVCGMNRAGKVLLRKRLYRSEVLSFFAQASRCTVALESCGGSCYWAREIEALGYTVKLIPAQYVKPYVKSQKNDRVDAEAIAEAASRPTMRFVSPNTVSPTRYPEYTPGEREGNTAENRAFESDTRTSS